MSIFKGSIFSDLFGIRRRREAKELRLKKARFDKVVDAAVRRAAEARAARKAEAEREVELAKGGRVAGIALDPVQAEMRLDMARKHDAQVQANLGSQRPRGPLSYTKRGSEYTGKTDNSADYLANPMHPANPSYVGNVLASQSQGHGHSHADQGQCGGDSNHGSYGGGSSDTGTSSGDSGSCGGGGGD